jgi:hypothetical protein
MRILGSLVLGTIYNAIDSLKFINTSHTVLYIKEFYASFICQLLSSVSLTNFYQFHHKLLLCTSIKAIYLLVVKESVTERIRDEIGQ